jgi:hypothetical protein
MRRGKYQVTEDRRYERLDFDSPADTLMKIGAGVQSEVIRSLLGASLESAERLWVESCAIALTLSADPQIQRAALLAIGHLARRFSEVDEAAVRVVLERLRNDPDLAEAVTDLEEDLIAYGMFS